MRQYYKPLLTLIIIFLLMISGGLLLFGTYDTTQADPPACEEQFKRECILRKEAPKPGLICPSPRQPCPLETTDSRDNNKLEQEDR